MANDEINFDEVKEDDAGLSLDDFSGTTKFVKNAPVGQELILEVDKIVDNPKISAVNKTTGAEFPVGLKWKSGTKRYDIHTIHGEIYTVTSSEIYFKLFGIKPEGVLRTYAKAHEGSFKGAKVSIKKNFESDYMNTKISDLAKIKGISEAEATKFQEQIKLAVKEQRLFEVKVL